MLSLPWAANEHITLYLWTPKTGKGVAFTGQSISTRPASLPLGWSTVSLVGGGGYPRGRTQFGRCRGSTGIRRGSKSEFLVTKSRYQL
jgi:hypothetical protein